MSIDETTDAIEQPAESTVADPRPSDAHEHHEPSDGHYILIAVALMVLTALEVLASYVDTGPFLVPLLMVMMTIKFLVVVFWFMHLRFDNKLFRRLFFTGLVLAVFVYLVAMATFRFFMN